MSIGALTQPRIGLAFRAPLVKGVFPLKAGIAAFEGGVACYDTADLGHVKKGDGVTATLVPFGLFTQSRDNSAGGSDVLGVGVELWRERRIVWMYSVTGGGAVALANLFGTVYLASDQEVTTSNATGAPAGRLWAIAGVTGGLGINLVRQDGIVVCGVEFPY